MGSNGENNDNVMEDAFSEGVEKERQEHEQQVLCRDIHV